jgi:hypothetical protein
VGISQYKSGYLAYQPTDIVFLKASIVVSACRYAYFSDMSIASELLTGRGVMCRWAHAPLRVLPWTC